MYNSLNLKKVSPLDVNFYNVFVGETRFLELIVNGNKYFLTLHEKIDGLIGSIKFGISIANHDSFLIFKTCPILDAFDEKFKDIDLVLLPEVVCLEIADVIWENLLGQLSAILKLDFKIKSIRFDGLQSTFFEKQVGVSILDSGGKVVTVGNLDLNSDLLSLLISNFSKIPATKGIKEQQIDFDVFLRAGSTHLSKDEYNSLREYDIIFLDDDTQIRSGTFILNGIDPIRASGVFENGKFKITDIIK